jgi:DNA-binding transcriptional MerR regulator
MERRIYYSAADAARILGVTPATVRQMRRRGDLPAAAKTIGGVHLFDPVTVDRLAAVRAERTPAGRVDR